MHSRACYKRLGQKLHRLAAVFRAKSSSRPLRTAHAAARGVHSSPPWPNTRPVTSVVEDGPLNRAGPVTSPGELMQLLARKKESIQDDYAGRKVNEHAVFTNSEISLKHVDVYGFDFDYTLIHYTQELHRLIYEVARDRLVGMLNYPTAIKGISYNPNFAIRGLHCDITKGFLMKIDAYNQIQLSSVYRGHAPVSPDEVAEHYGGTHVPMHVTDNLPTGSEWKLTQFLDLFSMPEATLLADIVEYLLGHGIPFDPEYLYEDVQTTVQEVHNLGDIHTAIASDLERYVERTPRIPVYLNRLKGAKKKLFMITNSPYWFVNKGMTHAMQSPDWRDLFDVVIVGARKPSFYSEANRPFRLLNSDAMTASWSRVTELVPGKVYQQGNVNDFIGMTGWKGSQVLYFGDHVFSDLADPSIQHSWKTGAIIPELEVEIRRATSPEFQEHLAKMLALEKLLQEHQGYGYTNPELVVVLDHWRQERKNAKRFLKETHNKRFGSVFRTEKNPTYFTRRLATFANLYMSSLDSLMNYSLDYTFIPRRGSLPHEPDLNFDL